MISVVQCLFSLVAFVGTVYFFFWRSKKTSNYPPGPTGLPLVGYVPFLGDNFSESFMKIGKKYGPMFSIQLGTRNWIVLNEYDVIKEAFVDQGQIFSSRPKLHIYNRLSQGFGLTFTDFSNKWKHYRKFAVSALRGRGTIEKKMVEEMKYFVEAVQSYEEKSFNIQEAIGNAMSNNICSVLLGNRFSYTDRQFNEIVPRLNRLFSATDDVTLRGIIVLAPIMRYFPFFRGAYMRMFSDAGSIIGVLKEIFYEHKETFDENHIRDFIDELILEMKNDGKNVTFSERQWFQVMRDLFAAGTETTTHTMKWSVLCFAHYPEYQEKIHEEVKAVLGESGIPSTKHRDEMPYTCAFLQEIMRHRILSPLSIPHLTDKDTTLRGFRIPKNTPVLANLWAVHNDPVYFENPKEFRPERFIDANGAFIPCHRVIPFSMGPRTCPGESFARTELFLYLCSIVQNFEVVADPEKPLPPFMSGLWGSTHVTRNFEVIFRSR